MIKAEQGSPQGSEARGTLFSGESAASNSTRLKLCIHARCFIQRMSPELAHLHRLKLNPW